jgi:hypothetical protein
MGWHVNDLTERAKAPLGIFDPSGYAFVGQQTQHVLYQGFGNGDGDGHVHELWWNGVWHHSDLTNDSNAPLISAQPSGYAFEGLLDGGTQHAIFQGVIPGQGDDGLVHEIWWDEDDTHSGLLTAAGDGAPVMNSPFGYGFGGQQVVFEGGDNHVYYLGYDLDDGWNRIDLTALTSAGVAAMLPPSGYWFDAEHTNHVLFVGFDGHVHELWRLQQRWHHNDLTARVKSPVASDQAIGFAVDPTRNQIVHYRGNDGHLHQLWWDASGWHYIDMTATVGGASPVSGAVPAGYFYPYEGTSHVDYLGVDGHIHEYWRDTAGWHHIDLTTTTGCPTAISNPTSYVFPPDNTQHVIFRSSDRHIIELYWLPS